MTRFGGALAFCFKNGTANGRKGLVLTKTLIFKKYYNIIRHCTTDAATMTGAAAVLAAPYAEPRTTVIEWQCMSPVQPKALHHTSAII